MPNDVYIKTHTALSAIVSPRVAAGVLDQAIASAGCDGDSVTVSTMRHLLAGDVRKGLAGTFPRAALTYHLKLLADELAASAPPQPKHRTPVADALIAEAEAERAYVSLTSERLAAAELTTDPGPTSPAPTTARSGPLATVPSTQFVPDAAEGRLAGRAPVVPRRRRRTSRAAEPASRRKVARLPEPALDRVLKLFGDIEAVRQVVVLRRNAILLQRGEGVDPERLPGLVLSSRHLLARSSDLRALSVEHPTGVLFLFPFGEDSLIVVTQGAVNIGAVLNARAALEEAA